MVEVHAPSRLHFGLLLPQGQERRYGGVGAMIDEPGLRLRFTSSENWQANGLLAERAEKFARLWAAHHGLSGLPQCRVEVISAPQQHIGLGVGTQLGLSIAAGLCAVHQIADTSPRESAASVDRGRRSAIGTHGFFLGGLLADQGKATNERLAPLAWRVALPEDWRFVLLMPRVGNGVSGAVEERAFAALPGASGEVITRLHCQSEIMRSAAESGQFDRLSEALYEFGRASGECFAAAQGGVFASPRLEHWVNRLRDWGVAGVGQSSWGPTLYALSPGLAEAQSLFQRITTSDTAGEWRPLIAAPNNSGATVISKQR